MSPKFKCTECGEKLRSNEVYRVTAPETKETYYECISCLGVAEPIEKK